MRVLITGMEGFVGSHLAELALVKKAEVHGSVLPSATLQNLLQTRRLHIHPVDITDADVLQQLMKSVKPKWIFHLAGQSSPMLSRRNPEQTLRINIQGNMNVLEAARQYAPQARILVVGSSDEYGDIESGIRHISERHALAPDNPYAVSKTCQDLMGLAYFRHYGLPVIRVRPFNHIGPRQALGFVATDFASQIVSIEKGRTVPLIEVGNLDVIRDFSDVRDVVLGYWALMQTGKAGEVYNVGSGRGITVRQLLQGLLRLTVVKIDVHVRHVRIREEKMRKVAAVKKIYAATGWRTQILLAETLQTVIEDWRKRLG